MFKIWPTTDLLLIYQILDKVLERVVAGQLRQCLSINNLLEPFQFGFRLGHSTKTPCLGHKWSSHPCWHGGFIRYYCCLWYNISYCFSRKLRAWLGITGTAFDWFKSHLTDHFQFVCLGNNKSEPRLVLQGVPQGSVLGPILFRIYMLPLGEIIYMFGLGFHCYADDAQIYLSTHPSLNLAVAGPIWMR